MKALNGRARARRGGGLFGENCDDLHLVLIDYPSLGVALEWLALHEAKSLTYSENSARIHPGNIRMSAVR